MTGELGLEALRFLEGLRDHITTQLERIASENDIRLRLVQEELDRRFSRLERLMDERRDNQRRDGQLLQEELDRRVADLRENFQPLLADVKAGGDRHIADLRALLDERYATQTKALDAAFKAAEQAVAVALANAEKAVAKAEGTADARFASVNEFRQTLTDQASTFLSRAEYDAAHKGVSDRVAANGERMAALELRITSRLDRGEGVDLGQAGRRTEQRLTVTQAIAGLAVIVAIVSVILYATKH